MTNALLFSHNWKKSWKKFNCQATKTRFQCKKRIIIASTFSAWHIFSIYGRGVCVCRLIPHSWINRQGQPAIVSCWNTYFAAVRWLLWMYCVIFLLCDNQHAILLDESLPDICPNHIFLNHFWTKVNPTFVQIVYL